MQCITKAFSAKGAMVSQVVPFLEILKMGLDSSQSSDPETTDQFRGILTTKDEMLTFYFTMSILLILTFLLPCSIQDLK